MASLIVVVAFIVGDSNAALVLSAISSILVGGGLVAIVTLRSTVRKASSEADQADLEVDDLRARLTRQVLDSVNAELSRYREQVAEERTRAANAVQGQAQAQSALAAVQVELAQALEQASKERHTLRNELAALGVENARLKIEVGELRAEIETLRAQLDAERHGRRADDPAP